MAVKMKESDEMFAVKKMKKSYIVKTKYIKYIQNERKVMEEVCKDHPFLIGLKFVKFHFVS